MIILRGFYQRYLNKLPIKLNRNIIEFEVMLWGCMVNKCDKIKFNAVNNYLTH